MRILKPSILLVLVYGLPLVGMPSMLIGVPLLLAAAGAWVLLVSQPEMRKQDNQEHRATDKNSMLLLLSMGLLAHVLPVVEWRLRGFPGFDGNFVWLQWLGLATLIVGMTLRIHAIRLLGRFFTVNVQIQQNHELIKQGIYSRVRHPSYLGAWLAIVGHASLLGASWSIFGVGLLMLYAYHKRIRVEEQALQLSFGSEYTDYSSRTARLFPGLW